MDLAALASRIRKREMKLLIDPKAPMVPRVTGGAWQDDDPENIQAVHWWCNGEKGSSRG